MELYGLLSLGFLIGMGHALEADHMAAVATLNDSPASKRHVVTRGAYWGLGHTVALLLICGLVFISGISLNAQIEATLELLVGLLIIFLGMRVLRRIKKMNIHLHLHEHDGNRHLHAHSHDHNQVSQHSAPHAVLSHQHRHMNKENFMALSIGLLHGAAGSGGLLVLIVAATQSISQSLLYVSLFGLGSILGMAALSFAASLPLSLMQKGASWLQPVTSMAIAGFAFWIGGSLASSSFLVLSELP